MPVIRESNPLSRCFPLGVSELLALRTEEEWEEVRQRISDLPEDDSLTAELNKVLPSTHLLPGSDLVKMK